jgi:hypothetical protein
LFLMNRPTKPILRIEAGGQLPPRRPPGFDIDIDTQPVQDFFEGVGANFFPAFQAQQLGGGGQGSFVLPRGAGLPSGRTTTGTPTPSLGKEVFGNATIRPTSTGDTSSAGLTFEEYLASMGVGRNGGSSRPDFSGYRAALTGQAEELNARIQAMYNQLAEQAGANVGRIQDIYGGAQEGIGGVYDSASGNVQQAFGSAQQQAADQLARLGIEAAAPTVINPMALSQAQAVSGLEQGRASGQAAAERYGATAGGFGSQMAQVAQQQGTEMNAAILAALQGRLAESLAAEQSGGGGGGGGGMSVRDQLALREAYNRDVLGELPLDERRFAFEVAESAAAPLNNWVEDSVARYMEAQFPRGSRINPDEYWAAEAAARQRARQQVGLE